MYTLKFSLFVKTGIVFRGWWWVYFRSCRINSWTLEPLEEGEFKSWNCRSIFMATYVSQIDSECSHPKKSDGAETISWTSNIIATDILLCL